MRGRKSSWGLSVALVVAGGLGAAVACRGDPPPVTPWSFNFESPLRDTLSPLLRMHAPRVLCLDQAQRSELEGLLLTHGERWTNFDARARPVKEACDARIESASEMPQEQKLALQLERETLLAPLATEQAEIDRALLEAVRTRFGSAKPSEWSRLGFLLDRLRSRNDLGGFITNAVDLPGLADEVATSFPECVTDRESYLALIASFCERTRGLRESVREADVAFSRNFFRLSAASSRGDLRIADDAATVQASDGVGRTVLDLLRRRTRAAETQARLIVETRGLLEARLVEPALGEFRKGFWRSIAEAGGVTWWPREIDRFRAELVSVAGAEARVLLSAAFDDAFRRALGRIEAFEALVRDAAASSRDSSPASRAVLDDLARATDLRERAELKALLDGATALVTPEQRSSVRVPVLVEPAR